MKKISFHMNDYEDVIGKEESEKVDEIDSTRKYMKIAIDGINASVDYTKILSPHHASHCKKHSH